MDKFHKGVTTLWESLVRKKSLLLSALRMFWVLGLFGWGNGLWGAGEFRSFSTLRVGAHDIRSVSKSENV